MINHESKFNRFKGIIENRNEGKCVCNEKLYLLIELNQRPGGIVH